MIATARAAGADINKWLLAKAIIAAAGAAAEAKFLHRAFSEIWDGYEAENDMVDLVRNAKCADLDPQQIQTLADQGLQSPFRW